MTAEPTTNFDIEKSRVVLLDVAGTTTSLGFLKETLLQHVLDNSEEFLKNNWDDVEVQKAVKSLVDDKLELDIKEANEAVVDLTKKDSNNNSLKTIQGMIYKAGYENGKLKSHVFDDVAPAIEVWAKARQVCIYSTGSVESQRLLFSNSVKGDLSVHITKYFDQSVGKKTESESYKIISDELKVKPEEIVFITDNVEEAAAAKGAGVLTGVISREGNEPLPVDVAKEHTLLTSFKDAIPETTSKRKNEENLEAPVSKIPKTDVTDDGPKKEEISEEKPAEETMEVDISEAEVIAETKESTSEEKANKPSEAPSSEEKPEPEKTQTDQPVADKPTKEDVSSTISDKKEEEQKLTDSTDNKPLDEDVEMKEDSVETPKTDTKIVETVEKIEEEKEIIETIVKNENPTMKTDTLDNTEVPKVNTETVKTDGPSEEAESTMNADNTHQKKNTDKDSGQTEKENTKVEIKNKIEEPAGNKQKERSNKNLENSEQCKTDEVKTDVEPKVQKKEVSERKSAEVTKSDESVSQHATEVDRAVNENNGENEMDTSEKEKVENKLESKVESVEKSTVKTKTEQEVPQENETKVKDENEEGCSDNLKKDNEAEKVEAEKEVDTEKEVKLHAPEKAVIETEKQTKEIVNSGEDVTEKHNQKISETQEEKMVTDDGACNNDKAVKVTGDDSKEASDSKKTESEQNTDTDADKDITNGQNEAEMDNKVNGDIKDVEIHAGEEVTKDNEEAVNHKKNSIDAEETKLNGTEEKENKSLIANGAENGVDKKDEVTSVEDNQNDKADNMPKDTDIKSKQIEPSNEVPANLEV